MRIVRLAPSDLKYLYDACPRCWWLKTRDVPIPKDIIPAVFRDMDMNMKKAVTVPLLNSLGIPATGTITVGRLRRMIDYPELDVRLVISGYLDLAVHLENGSAAVIDYKVSNSNDLAGFARQVHCYVAALEDPEGSAMEVSAIGLVVFRAEGEFHTEVRPNGVLAAQKGTFVHVPLELDRETFWNQMEGVARLAAGDMPSPGTGCPRCLALHEINAYVNRRKVAS